MARRKNYMFTNRKHSDKAIMGCILGIISLASLITVVFLTYRQNGNAPSGYGITGLLAAVFSLVGLVLDIFAAGKKNSFPLFPWVGIVLNGMALLALGFLLYIGR